MKNRTQRIKDADLGSKKWCSFFTYNFASFHGGYVDLSRHLVVDDDDDDEYC
jgi:hypothetical protein